MRIVPLVTALALAACTTFEDAATTPDGGATSDASTTDATNEGGKPTTGCAAAPAGFLLCSDFDEGASVVQPTKPDAKQWFVQQSGTSTLTITSAGAFSGSNVLTAAGDGSTASFQAQATVREIVTTRKILRIAMQMRIGKLPTSGHDAYLATLEFVNARITAVLHPDGTIGLAQTALPGNTVQKKNLGNATAVGPGVWKRLEIYVNRASGKTEAGATLDGVGPVDTLIDNPTGNAAVSVGIGYCDVPCGSPSVDFDDVVLTEE